MVRGKHLEITYDAFSSTIQFTNIQFKDIEYSIKDYKYGILWPVGEFYPSILPIELLQVDLTVYSFRNSMMYSHMLQREQRTTIMINDRYFRLICFNLLSKKIFRWVWLGTILFSCKMQSFPPLANGDQLCGLSAYYIHQFFEIIFKWNFN